MPTVDWDRVATEVSRLWRAEALAKCPNPACPKTMKLPGARSRLIQEGCVIRCTGCKAQIPASHLQDLPD